MVSSHVFTLSGTFDVDQAKSSQTQYANFHNCPTEFLLLSTVPAFLEV